MRAIATVAVMGLAVVLVAGCNNRPRPQADLMDRGRDIFLVLRYDANHDGTVTREEMEAGLKADYAAADVDHDGKLEPNEVQAENQRRWAKEGPQSSPLMDWNQDGNVDIAEFANAVHSLFASVDKDKDNMVTVSELQAPRSLPTNIPRPPLDANTDSQPSPMPGQSGSGYPGGYPGSGGYPGN